MRASIVTVADGCRVQSNPILENDWRRLRTGTSIFGISTFTSVDHHEYLNITHAKDCQPQPRLANGFAIEKRAVGDSQSRRQVRRGSNPMRNGTGNGGMNDLQIGVGFVLSDLLRA